MRLVRPFAITPESLIATNVDEPQTLWSSATAYVTNNVVYRVIDGLHQGFKARRNNTNKPPETSLEDWDATGPTAPYRMFDQAVQSQTERADDITVSVAVTGRVDTVALLNIRGQTVTVTVEDDDVGVVYDETYSLTTTAGINNWAAYFREPIERADELILQDLPPGYSSPTVTVTIANPGAVAKCGAMVVGRGRTIGLTRYSPRLGLIDYSLKKTNDFGEYTVVERPFSDTADFQILIENAQVDPVKRLLAGYRATPILYIGSPHYAATAVYGFVREFNIEIAYPTRSLCSLSLEGLT